METAVRVTEVEKILRRYKSRNVIVGSSLLNLDEAMPLLGIRTRWLDQH